MGPNLDWNSESPIGGPRVAPADTHPGFLLTRSGYLPPLTLPVGGVIAAANGP